MGTAENPTLYGVVVARADAEAEWTPAHPTDVVLTLGRLASGRSDPVQRTGSDGSVWRTARTPDGPATVRYRGGLTRLQATAWGPGADAGVAGAPELLGARDDPSGFVPRHPVLEDAHRRFPGIRIARTGDVVSAVVAVVLEQRVVGLDAIRAWHGLVTEFGEPAPGPAPSGMRVVPPGGTWAGIPSWRWHRAGVDPRRAAIIQEVSRRTDAVQRLADRSPEDAGAALRSIRGIGEWTAAEVRQRALGDADAVSVGDFHLAAMVGSVLEGRRFTDAELVAYLEPWRGHRYRVARLLYALGYESAPPRGPRTARTDHRGR